MVEVKPNIVISKSYSSFFNLKGEQAKFYLGDPFVSEGSEENPNTIFLGNLGLIKYFFYHAGTIEIVTNLNVVKPVYVI